MGAAPFGMDMTISFLGLALRLFTTYAFYSTRFQYHLILSSTPLFIIFRDLTYYGTTRQHLTDSLMLPIISLFHPTRSSLETSAGALLQFLPPAIALWLLRHQHIITHCALTWPVDRAADPAALNYRTCNCYQTDGHVSHLDLGGSLGKLVGSKIGSLVSQSVRPSVSISTSNPARVGDDTTPARSGSHVR
ncbi:hypothetical protein BO99DRAFT_262471 [Aspergillus violaceofuscus CBS 115571]|uniref:Uncharacterized protein n=1 Tax=Aspergillus violaceofuscus (strain CBS 115571) TaxID=1450538 RepID=A0A2V5I6E3_ASPV1|nr:hypothetical protein BO99DRAFT_262471 [Aspergillus violaceofuscus CBS 115571]